MTTNIVVTESIELNRTKAPQLPAAPVEYDRQYSDALTNILRQYFNTLDNFVGQLTLSAGGSGAGVFLPYGSFADTTDQPLAAANTATVMTFNTTDFASGVSIVTSGGKASRFTVTNPGIYNFQWSGQFQNIDTQEHDVSVWVRKNGTDVVGSTGYIAVVSSHGGIDGHTIVGWNFLFNLAANDYIELWWSATDTNISIQAYPAVTTPPAAVKPSTSSLVATMTFVSAL
jgi:hypothetical protein